MKKLGVEKEIEMVSLMITIYQKGHQKEPNIEADCLALKEYAITRIRGCPKKETKTFCSKCEIHCYQPAMRAKIKQVMRYAGPRMLWHHPLLALTHFIEGKRKSV